jgi:hypothetical protein
VVMNFIIRKYSNAVETTDLRHTYQIQGRRANEVHLEGYQVGSVLASYVHLLGKRTGSRAAGWQPAAVAKGPGERRAIRNRSR